MATNKVVISKGSSSFTLPVAFNSLEISIEDIYSSNAGRNANGTFVGTRITTKYTISGTMRPLSDTEMKSYLQIMKNTEFSVTFRDPATNENKTITCYRATPKASVYSYADKLPRYNAMTFEFVEI